MTSLVEIPITKITPHPKNVRRDVAVDDELVNSIKEQGILQPIGVVPAGAKYLLIAGHRRLAAAKTAKLKAVPAIVLEHLDTEASQIEAMLVENGRRLDLSPMEEADAYEQLTLLGVDAAAIATKTGRSTQTVKARLALTKLPKKASAALHEHQITLQQAELFISLEDYPDLLASALKSMDGGNFDYALRSAANRAKELAEEAKLREEYTAMGLPEIKMPKGGWDYNTGPRPIRVNDNETADAWYSGKDSKNHWETEPRLIRSVIPERKKTAEDLKWEKQRERDEAKRKQHLKDVQLATQLRLEHVASLTAGLQISKELRPHLQNAVARMVAGMTSGEISTVITATGIDSLKREKNDYNNVVLAAQILDLNLGQLLTLFGAALAQIASGLTYVGWGQLAGQSLENSGRYWAAFDTSSYALPKVDATERADLDKKIAAAQQATEGDAA